MPSIADQSRTLHAKLQKLFAKAKMPSSPALAARILELIRDPNSSAGDFGEIIRTDAALSARLLKMANSARFAQRTGVTTIERAVTVLGLRRIKTISVGFQLVGHLDRLGSVPFDMRVFWQHSLLRACLARSIAQTVVPQQAEEAFLIGLLEDCGIILLVQALGSEYADLYCSGNLSPSAFYVVEKTSFPHTHVEAISVMASEWHLPETIAIPLARHHQPVKLREGSSDTQRLRAVGYLVGGLRFTKDLTVDASEQELREFSQTTLGLDDAAWAKVQRLAADDFHRMAILYADNLPEDTDVAELLSEANHQLTAVAGQADERLLDVEAERQKLHDERGHLTSALAEYRERAARDPLTGLLNRGALLEAARRAIAQSQDDGALIGALFVDIDNFKAVNDTHGHGIGDKVLKAVGTSISQEAGHRGATGRYGGEEFVVILRGLDLDEIRGMGERVVQRVRALDFSSLGIADPITCSVGAVGGTHGRVTSAEALFAAADHRMYQAKRSGKNRCCFEPLGEGTPSTRPDGRRSCGRANSLSSAQKAGTQGAAAVGLEAMRVIAERLNRQKETVVVDGRKERRKRLVAPCTLHYFTYVGANMQAEPACLRTLSTGGAGLLVARPMVRGEPVEVALDQAGSKLFLAGLVSFCRQVEDSIHEVGLQFVTRSVTPIISGDAEAAVRDLKWVADALSAAGKR